MPKKVLIVDDEEDLVDIMKCLLVHSGYEVLTAYNGSECLDLLKTQTPRLIIMDILMPKMTGYEVIKKIREIDAFVGTPIIVTTARKDMKVFLNSWDVDDYIFKPFNPDELVEKVEKAIRLSNQSETESDVISAEAEHRRGRRKAVLAACSDFVTLKIKTIFEKYGYYVVMADKNKEVIRQVERFAPPNVIVCEISDSTGIHAEMIYRWVHEKPNCNCAFLVFCEKELSEKTLKIFDSSQVISYESGDELLTKFEEYAKVMDRNAA